MARGAIGVVVGAIAWMAAFFLLAWLLASIWPDYAARGRTWYGEQLYTFTMVMSVFNASFWILAEIIAGWITFVTAKRREAAWFVAGLIGLYLGFMHLHYVWDTLPRWYNLAVAIPAVPAVLLGAKLAGAFQSKKR